MRQNRNSAGSLNSMKKLSIVLSCVLFAGSLTAISAQSPATPFTLTYTYSGYAVPIMIDSANSASLLTITVPRALTVQKVTASVQLSYPNVGDLNVYMYSPLRTRAKLLERNCGSLRDVDTTFDDSAPSMYAEFCPAEAGRGPFRGNEPLSNFNGQNALGTWTLAVENNGSDSRTGYAVAFSMTITGLSRQAAAMAPDGIRSSAVPLVGGQPIAPGELVSIFGYNLGPQDGVTPNQGYWPTWVDGTNVRINNVDAPIRSISFYRIEVQVPMGLDLSKNAQVTVFRNSVATNPIEVPVDTTVPAIFTTDRTGTGQAEAVNSDGSSNGRNNPANVGSVITLHCTGMGMTEPLANEGQPVPGEVDFNTAWPTVIVGGTQAEVKKSVLLAGSNAVYGVDIVVPMTLRGAGEVEVAVGQGGRISQRGVTIHVQ